MLSSLRRLGVALPALGLVVAPAGAHAAAKHPAPHSPPPTCAPRATAPPRQPPSPATS